MASQTNSQARLQAGGSRRGRFAGFAGNPYLTFGPRPLRERYVRSYILRQHRAGRTLAQILQDERLGALAGRTLVWRVLIDPVTLRSLGDDVRDGIDPGSGRLE
jgi:hypothetical protein